VVSTVSTTMPAETITKTQTEEISITETTTLVTTMPPLTSTQISTQFETQEVLHTITVSSTFVETSIITQTSTTKITEFLPPVTSTYTMLRPLPANIATASTQTSIEVVLVTSV